VIDTNIQINGSKLVLYVSTYRSVVEPVQLLKHFRSRT